MFKNMIAEHGRYNEKYVEKRAYARKPTKFLNQDIVKSKIQKSCTNSIFGECDNF